MRIALATDWVPMPEPSLLWINSIVLIAVSLTLEIARRAINNQKEPQYAFFMAGALTVLFLVLQIIVWGELIGLGYHAQHNPSNAFFYVLTALHALHLVGGLVAWMRALWRMRSKTAEYGAVRLSVELCAIYWHFLLLVWFIVLALFITT